MRPLRVLAPAGILASAMLAADAPPVDPGLTEKVEVKLVVLDVLVLDKKGKSIPG